jgi:hypothetical protein
VPSSKAVAPLNRKSIVPSNIKGNDLRARKGIHMDRFDPERRADLSGVVQLLERERPVLTFDELERLDRRLSTCLVPPRPPRRRTRLSVVICLAVGLLFMTAGTGLAISGFATPGAADHAQYPDRTGRRPPTSGGGTAAPRKGTGGHRRPSSLGQIPRNGRASTGYLSLIHAETHNNPPFTGFGAIPILLAGIVLIIRGGTIDRRIRRR